MPMPEIQFVIRITKSSLPTRWNRGSRTVFNQVRHACGKRIAHDDTFLDELAEVRPSIYFQFDGSVPSSARR